ESGVSPRAFPMQGKALVVTDSDEHDETGHLIEDAANRTAMVRKRLRKLEGLRSDIWQPRLETTPKAETTIIGWGSTYGAIREAAQKLGKSGLPVNHLHLNQVWPFPAETITSALSNSKHSYVVENNATGQMAKLIRSETGIAVSGGVNKFDGRPFSSDEIFAAIVKEASKW
ncbi:MAG: transketolase C-terminal domain-containing protein, partial [Dehalococcoidia bacterium]|nr:transketolase C-terminal domain-containing protein [Dehalococcoidia bacterium]